MSNDRFVPLAERIRTAAALVDGSLLDEATWAERHHWISLLGWCLALGCAAVALFHGGSEQWIYIGCAIAAMAGSGIGAAGRRPREMAVALNFLAVQMFVNRYLGNLLLGPIEIVILTFYQDWVPIVLGCLLALGLVVLATVDPAIFTVSKGFEAEVPVTGMAFRAAAVIASATVAGFIWRLGTQRSRDPLTGLVSRAGAARLLDRYLRRGWLPAVWVCDVDDFAAVNSQLGLDIGDRLLLHVAGAVRRLHRSLPAGWICARLGADTFLIGSPGASDLGELDAFAHRIADQVGVPFGWGGADEIPVRVSVGAATAAAGETARALIDAAEQNMRSAKRHGFNRIVVERPIQSKAVTRHTLLTAELYRACEHDELELHLQPIARLADGMPVGAEALVRWNHPDRGLVWPGEFLPQAERDSALMAMIADVLGVQFLRIVSELVGNHGRDWLPAGYAYNLAPIRLSDPMVVTRTVQMMTEFGIDNAESLCTFELTEGALIEVEDDALGVLSSFRELGFKIALDDFGTGYSSLAQLPNLPLDTVKIDQSFVRGLGQTPTANAVVQAVADIASAAGLTVVAEGVETPLQRDLLMAINPHLLAQGWLYARSMPVAEFEAWVDDRKLVLRE